MGRRLWIAAIVTIALGSTIAWWLGSARHEDHARAQERRVAPASRIVAQAQIVPVDGIIEVRPLAEGKVLKVLVQPGDRVETDQLLAEIESDLPRAAVEQRAADVKAASERLALTTEGVRPEDREALAAAAEAARNEADLAQDRWQRQRRLFEQGFISEQAVIEAERNALSAQARAHEAGMRAKAGVAGGRPAEVRAAREQVAAAGAALSQGKVVLSRTKIVAPIGGVIMSRSVNPGDIIGSNVTSPTLFKIVNPERTEARLEIEELLADRVAVGMPVTFVLPGSKTPVGQGKVTRVAPQVEKRSIGADDARARADSMVRPAWSDFTPAGGNQPPVNYRLEAWIQLSDKGPRTGTPPATGGSGQR
ncbi:MAG TPA: HlyD family efflux transporter periplasmic adaptor subunit [Burkholderiales bacterium]|nr:HlyD family efflux transporter periplasmic adaptor subunit [Burkholderiales bacterium]